MTLNRKTRIAFAVIFSICLHFSATDRLPYKNSTLPTNVRVAALLSRMPLEETLVQIRHVHSWHILNRQELDYDN